MAYDADPDAFVAPYADAERALTDRILAAQKLVGRRRAVRRGAAEDRRGVRGLRGRRDARRHRHRPRRRRARRLARTGPTVTREDIRAAARLALPHRRRRNPFDAPGLDEDLLDQILGDDEPDPTRTADPEPGRRRPDEPATTRTTATGAVTPTDRRRAPPHRRPADGSSEPRTQPTVRAADRAAAGPTHRRRPGRRTGRGCSRSAAPAPARPGDAAGRSPSNGRRVGARPGRRGADPPDRDDAGGGAAPARRAVVRRAGCGSARDDLRVATREGHESNLVLFCVDASGSMAARKRMEQVKTAILSLLLDAYQRRDKVGLVTFRGDARRRWRCRRRTRSTSRPRRLAGPARGRAHAAGRGPARGRPSPRARAGPRPAPPAAARRRHRRPRDRRGRRRGALAHRRPALLAAAGVGSLVVDCETGPFRLGLAARAGRAPARRARAGRRGRAPSADLTGDAVARAGSPDAAGTADSSSPTTGSPPASAATGRC